MTTKSKYGIGGSEHKRIERKKAAARKWGWRQALRTRFDYENQAWIVDGKYVSCGHPDSMKCKCYGKVHAGETAKGDK